MSSHSVSIDRQHDALLVIDVQHDFVDGSVAIPDALKILPVINALVPRFVYRIFTRDWHPAGHVSFASSHGGARPGDVARVGYGNQQLFADHAVQDTHGAQLHSSLLVPPDAWLLDKGTHQAIDSFSAFVENDRQTSTGLADRLRAAGISRLFLTGLALYGCVRHSALDARAAGFSVVIVDDACRERPSLQNAAHARELANAGVLRISSTDLTAADTPASGSRAVSP